MGGATLRSSRGGFGLSRALLDMLHAPRAAWVAPAIGAMLAAGAALASLALWPQGRVPTTWIVLDPSADGANVDAQAWIATQVDLIRSERVARRVLKDVGADALGSYAESSGDDAIGPLLARLEVESSGQGGVVGVRYRSNSAGLSALVANAFVAGYERVREEVRTAFTTAAAERARKRMSDLSDEVDRIQTQLRAYQGAEWPSSNPALAEAARVAARESNVAWSGLGQAVGADAHSALSDSSGAAASEAGWAAAGASGLQAVRQQFDLAQQVLAAARARYAQLNAEQASARPAMALLDRAEAPAVEGRSQDARIAWLAALAGLAGGWLLRVLAQWIDPRVRGPRQLAAGLGMPVFGALINAKRAAGLAPPPARALGRARRRGVALAPVAVPSLS